MLNAAIADASLHNIVFLEDSVATVSETGHVYISVMNLTGNPQSVRNGIRLGTVVPVSLVYKAIAQRMDQQKEKTEIKKHQIEFVNKVYEEIIYCTDSQLTFSSEFEFVFYRSHRRPMGPEANASLENISTEFDDLFMKHKADIGQSQRPMGHEANASLENIST